MQSGLTIEDNYIIISDVSFHPVSKLQMKVARFGMKPQIDSLSIVPDDVLGTWILVVTPTHKFLHALDNAEENYVFNTITHYKFYCTLIERTLCYSICFQTV